MLFQFYDKFKIYQRARLKEEAQKINKDYAQRAKGKIRSERGGIPRSRSFACEVSTLNHTCKNSYLLH